MKKVRITLEIDGEETRVLEGEMFLLNVVDREENGIMYSNYIGGMGSYPKLCRMLVSMSSNIHNRICEPTCKYKEQYKNDRDKE